MIEENPTGGEEAESAPLMTPEAQKKFLYAAGVIILMAGSFFAGRLSVQPRSNTPDSSQFKMPTPIPVGTPVVIKASELKMINFSGVADSKKESVVANANAKKCECNCGMTEAECIIKDPNCPYWKDHVIGLQSALGNGKKPDLSRAASKPMAFPQGGPNAVPQGLSGMGNQIQFPPQKAK